MKKTYDRMNPDKELLHRLRAYSKITWGAEAYAISVREAEYILDLIKDLDTEIMILKERLKNQDSSD